VKVIFHAEAESEYQNALRYYRRINPDLAERLYLEMERLIAEICAAPFQFREFDPPARRRLSFDFPYAIIYVPDPIAYGSLR
jgi:toxin ParE1/3/4